MQTSSDEPQGSGSRWEPAADEQATEVLTPPPAAPTADGPTPPPRRGISTTAAVLIAVLLGALGGAVAGLAVAGDRQEQPASGVVTEQGQGEQGQLPGAEGQFGGPGQGRHGFGDDHEGEYR